MGGTDWCRQRPTGLIPLGLSWRYADEEAVNRASSSFPAPVQHVGADRRRADIPVTQPLLNRADIGAVFEEMGSEGMANINERRDWGGGEVSMNLRAPEAVGDEVDDTLLGLQRSGNVQEGGGFGQRRVACEDLGPKIKIYESSLPPDSNQTRRDDRERADHLGRTSG